MESGRVNPTWSNVRRIAIGLRVPLQELAALAEHLESTHENGTAPRPESGNGGR